MYEPKNYYKNLFYNNDIVYILRSNIMLLCRDDLLFKRYRLIK